MKRVFGFVEAIFDMSYLICGLTIGIILLLGSEDHILNFLAGIMALVLVVGDAFHLVPRLMLILTQKEKELRRMLGLGKQVTSITMTLFYLILWQIGIDFFSPKNINIYSLIVYFLVFIRILICLLPQNDWQERYTPLNWGIYRNIPFFALGLIVAGLFFYYRNVISQLNLMYLAIIVSFTFYLPVVLFSNKNSKVGMLMLPKTCAYIWILSMFLSL